MKKKNLLLLVLGLVLLSACAKGEDPESTEASNTNVSSADVSAPVKSLGNTEDLEGEEVRTLTFLSGVDDKNQTKGDKYNFYALKGVAEGFNKVTAIIEGTAIDFRNTDHLWQFDYPYRGPSVATEITFTTDSTVKYGQTGIDLNSLNPKSYVTVTFIPNENPEVEEPSAIVNEGEKHTFRNEESEIIEVITVTNIEIIEADPTLNPIGEKLLKVEISYTNVGTMLTYMAPNYYAAFDSEKRHLPLRYTYFWLKEVLPGESFTDTIFYDVTSEGPYTIQFFDGAWLDLEENENNL